MDWNDVRVQLTGQILQGLLERDSGIISKIADEVLYKELAKFSVNLANATIEELKKYDV